MNNVQVARLISSIFHPFIIAIVSLAITAINSTNYNFMVAFYWISLVSLPLIIFPVCLLLFFKITNRIEDFDLSNRNQRHKLYPVALFLIFFVLILLWFLNAPKGIFSLILALISIFIVNFLINRSSKISIHTSAIVGFSTLLFIYYGFLVGIIGLLISIIVMWSRIVLKKHTLLQVLSAALVSSTIIFIFFYFQNN